jgi:hypothetical protein
MNKPHKKLRIVGERLPELDITRFADALITLALHRLEARTAPAAKHDESAPSKKERTS